MNGDGRADIVGFGANGVGVALGQSNGTFGPVIEQAHPGFDALDGWNSFDRFPRQLADVNGDGRADIVGFGANGVGVALGQSNGTFGPVIEQAHPGFDALDGWNSFDRFPRQLADVNGDGRADIVGFGANSVAVGLALELQAERIDTVLSLLSYSLANGENVENLTLTGTNNTAGTGNHLNNLIKGNVGNNLLSGLDGKDTLDGGNGNDELYGGNGNDELYGGTGDDNLVGGEGYDQLIGDAGKDELYGGDNFDQLYGGTDDDKLYGENGTFTNGVASNLGFTVNRGDWSSFDLYPRDVADVNGDGSADLIGFGHDSVFVSLSNWI